MLTKEERDLNVRQQKRFWDIVFDVVPKKALAMVEARVESGYNEEGYWRTYPFPHGVATLLTLKYVRVKSMVQSKPAEELLKDVAFLDNVLDLLNYALLLASVVLFLREEGVE